MFSSATLTLRTTDRNRFNAALILHVHLALDYEIDCLDFKRSFDPTSSAEWLELLKDIVAMANSGGGLILIGLDDDGSPVGDVTHLFELDPADITNKIYKYTDQQFHSFQILRGTKRGNTVWALSVGAVSIPMVFSKAGTYAVDNNRQKTAFSAGTVYFRHGAKSEPGCTEDFRNAFNRLLESTRRSWLDGIVKVIESPPGSHVAIYPPEVTQPNSPQAVPIRIVDDPNASPYFALRVDDTHPYRAKEVVNRVNTAISPQKITTHTILCIKRVYSMEKDIRYCYRMNYSSPRYSNAFIEWIIESIGKNSGFIDDVKTRFDQLRSTSESI